MNRLKILIVEDEPIIALEMKMRLQSQGHKGVAIVHSANQAIEYAVQSEPDVILMDIMLKGNMDGIEAATQIHTYREVPIIFMTGNSNIKTDERFIASKPFGILTKPIKDSELFEILERALAQKSEIPHDKPQNPSTDCQTNPEHVKI